MIALSTNLDQKIKDDVQYVVPKVIARMSDNRGIENLSWMATNENYPDQVIRLGPSLFWQFSESRLGSFRPGDSSGNGITGTGAGFSLNKCDTCISRRIKYFDAITDSFTRVDNATSLTFPSSTSYTSYLYGGDGIWGISSNQAYVTNTKANESCAVIESGNTNGTVSMKFGAAPVNYQGVVVRYVDVDNWIGAVVKISTSEVGILVNSAGVKTFLNPTLTTYSSGDTLAVTARFNYFQIYKNGTLVSGTSYFNENILLNGNKQGLLAGDFTVTSTARWDDLSIDMYDPVGAGFYSGLFDQARVYVTNAANLGLINPVNDEMSISFWVKNEDNAAANTGMFVRRYDDVALKASYQIERVANTSIKGTFYDAAGTAYSVTATSAILNAATGNPWVNVVFKKKAGVVYLYINGTLSGSTAMVNAIYTSTNGFFVTSAPDTTASTNWHVGYIDDISVFTRALSDSEISMLYDTCTNDGTLDDTGTFFTAEQAVNGDKEEGFAWAVTDSLDEWGNTENFSGEYKIVPSTTTHTDSMGWWSRSQSGGASTFAHSERAVFTFTAKPVNKLIVSTGYESGRIRQFGYTITKSDNTTISGTGTFPLQSEDTQNFGDNSVIEIDLVAMGQNPLMVTGLIINMISTQYPYDHGRIFEADLVWDIDVSADVQSFSYDKVRENNESTLPIGLTAANTGSLVLQNVDRRYNKYSTTSDLAPYIEPDVEFQLELGWFDEAAGTTEYLNIVKSMYVDEWTVDSSGMVATISLRDWSKYLQETTNSDGMTFKDVSAGRACTEVVKSYGFPARKIKYYDSYFRTIIQSKPWGYWPLCDVGLVSIEDKGGRYPGVTVGTGTTIIPPFILQDTKPYVYDIPRTATDTTVFDKVSKFARGTAASFTNRATFADVGGGLEYLGNFGVGITFKTSATLPTSIGDYFALTGKYDAYYGKWNYFISLKKIAADGYQFQGTVDTSISTVIVSSATFTSAQLAAATLFHLILSRDGSLLNLQVNGTVTSAVIAGTNKTSTDDMFLAGTPVDIGGNKHITDGSFSNLVHWNRALSIDEMQKQWLAVNLNSQYVFPYLFFSDSTPWDAMLEFATADVGIFYFDEDGYFNYEYSNTFHEPVFTRHTTAQYHLSDNVNVISGSHVVNVVSNRVIITVNPLLNSTSTSNIWSATDGESLAVTTLTADLNPDATSAAVTDTEDPLWLNTGYFKVDDEIIKYNSKTLTTLEGLERGQFGTLPLFHTSTSLVRETRHYDIKYSTVPAMDVRYPFLTAQIYDKTADIDSFSADAFHADIIVSANKSTIEGQLVVLQGTNPLTQIGNFFAIAGIPVESTSKSDQAVTEVKDLTTTKRKRRPKELTIDNKFIQDKDYAKKISEFLIKFFGEPVQVISLNTSGIPHLQLGDLIQIDSLAQLNIVNEKYWILESHLNYDGGLTQTIVARAYVTGL